MSRYLLIFPILFYIIFEVNSQTSCEFRGVEDNNTLSGTSFIENVGSNLCFSSMKQFPSPIRDLDGQVFIKLAYCYWTVINTRFSKALYLYEFQTGKNGGYLINSRLGSAVKKDVCLSSSAIHRRSKFISSINELSSADCQPDDLAQIWNFVKIKNGLETFPTFLQDNFKDIYQIQNNATGKCLKAVKYEYGFTVNESPCESNDGFQIWRICTSI